MGYGIECDLAQRKIRINQSVFFWHFNIVHYSRFWDMNHIDEMNTTTRDRILNNNLRKSNQKSATNNQIMTPEKNTAVTG